MNEWLVTFIILLSIFWFIQAVISINNLIETNVFETKLQFFIFLLIPILPVIYIISKMVKDNLKELK